MKYYRRVETIKNIVVTDHIKLTEQGFERNGPSTNTAKSMLVQWFNSEGEELSEASEAYNTLEAAFRKLPEEE